MGMMIAVAACAVCGGVVPGAQASGAPVPQASGAPASGGQASAPIGAYGTKGAWRFLSAPKLHPPKLHVDAPTIGKQLAPGYFMVANFPNLAAGQPLVGEGGPLILDRHLQPVWFHPVGVNVVATNLRAQPYRGKPALSWWQGVISSTGATISGTDEVVNQHYRKVATLAGKDGWVITPHELLISGQDAWVTVNKNVIRDLRAYGGKARGTLVDSAVQEYDLRTGKLLYTWDAGAPGEIPLSASRTRPPPNGSPWDAYHVNSIQLVGKGQFLTSMRNTWAAYLVQSRTKKIQWTLSGKQPGGDFSIPSNAQFQWQHDVELHPGGVVSIFDDHCCAIVAGKFLPPTSPSRGLVLKLDTAKHTATLVKQYLHDPVLHAAFLGSTQLLRGGNVVVGWGSQPYFSEYTSSGKLLLDAVFPGADLSYRVYLQHWAGTPFFPPGGAVRKHRGKATVYASWNGATGVVAWRVLAGRSAKHLVAVATKAQSGFETAIHLKHAYRVFKVQALDSSGRVIRTSRAFRAGRRTPSSLPGSY